MNIDNSLIDLNPNFTFDNYNNLISDWSGIYLEFLIIKKVNVLVYREDYGGEIGSNRWLKQFVGKARTTELVVGKNIAAISGATISVYSMTNAVNQLLYEMNQLDLI